MEIKDRIAIAKDKVVAFFRKPETFPAWIEVAFMDEIDIEESLAICDQMEADDLGLGINPREEWDRDIPGIPAWHFWRSI